MTRKRARDAAGDVDANYNLKARVTAADIRPVDNVIARLMTNVGQRVLVDFNQQAMDGYLKTKLLPIKLQEKFWRPLTLSVIDEWCFGTGAMACKNPGEKWSDIGEPAGVVSKDARWKNLPILGLNPSNVPPIVWDINDVSETWTFYGQKVHRSRLHFFQTLPTPTWWRGFGRGGMSCYLPLLVLERMLVGMLGRVDAYSLNVYFQAMDRLATAPKAGANTRAAASAASGIPTASIIPVDSQEKLVQLSERAGTGAEMFDIVLKCLSMSSAVPQIILVGMQQGAEAGAVTDLNRYGNALKMRRGQIADSIKDLALRFYGIDVDEFEWKSEFYENETQRLLNEKVKAETEQIRKGNAGNKENETGKATTLDGD